MRIWFVAMPSVVQGVRGSSLARHPSRSIVGLSALVLLPVSVSLVAPPLAFLCLVVANPPSLDQVGGAGASVRLMFYRPLEACTC